MKIKNLELYQVLQLKQEGLVLQGCGGEISEWVDGINEILTNEGILLNGSKFENIIRFEKDGLVNLIFDMTDVPLHIGKLAMWRLKQGQNFDAKWLSDYIDHNSPDEDCDDDEDLAECF
jgi:hypothetical protein